MQLHPFAPALCALLLHSILFAAPALGDETPPLVGEKGIKEYRSGTLGEKIIAYPGTFPPGEAEFVILPIMKAHPDLFEGKSVLEIGTGAGLISIYAAKLGATKVVSTDISLSAIRSARENARRLGVDSVMEVRPVPKSDMSAFSVIKSDERFDIIISNPPYALDLEAANNSPLIDKGDLGLSIVNGLEQHLSPSGSVVLYYGSLYYHLVMVKYAREMGYDVRTHTPKHMVSWEARALFLSYTRRLMEHENLPPDLLDFALADLEGIKIEPRDEPPLFPESGIERRFPGFLVIRNK